MPRLVAFLLVGALALRAAPVDSDEYRVKAAVVYNLAKFVEWPAQTFKADKDPIRICVLGQNPFGASLEQSVAGKFISGRPLAVEYVPGEKQTSNCQILFVSSSERRRLRAILAETRATSVLTVGEIEGFAEQGGIVNLKLVDNHVQMEINLEASGHVHLRIHSQVLNLAEIVKR